MKKHTKLGFGITALWIGFVIWIIHTNPQEIHDLALNEWGDFLAGAIAPLALIWFVIGYFLQSEELGLQREELTFQAQQIERQANVLESQFDLEKRKHQPHLVFESVGAEAYSPGRTKQHFQIDFKNKGAPANHTEIEPQSSNITGYGIAPKNNIDDDSIYSIIFDYNNQDDLPARIKFSYFDLEGNKYTHEGLLGDTKDENVNFFSDPIFTPAPMSKTKVTKI